MSPPEAPLSVQPIDPKTVPPATRRPNEAEKAQIDRWSKDADTAADAGKWDDVERLARQMLTIEERTYGPRHPEAAGSRMLLALSLGQRNRADEAEPFLRDAVEAFRTQLGPRQPLTMTATNFLADNLRTQRRYAAAEPLFRKVLEAQRAIHGERHADTAVSYDNVASILSVQGQHAEASDLYRRALDSRRAVFGDDHLETARSHDYLASNLFAQGRHAEADPQLRAALRIREAALGKQHYETAKSYQTVGINLNEQGRYADAETYFRQALEIRLVALGEGDISTAASYNGVAQSLSLQGRYDDAEPLVRKALAIVENVRGADHADTATGYSNLAVNLKMQARFADAESYFRKALDIRRRVQGERHLDTAVTYANLANSLDVQGRYAEAEPLHAKSLEIILATRGERSREAAASYNNLASHLDLEGRFVEAEAPHRKALEIGLLVFGERHPDIATRYNNLATNLTQQGRYPEAEALFRKALALTRDLLGEAHPDTGGTYSNLAYNLIVQGRYAEAEAFARKALEIRQAILGDRHPSTATAYVTFADSLSRQGRYLEAESLTRKALDIRRAVLGEQHAETASAYGAVAGNLNDQGRFAEAEMALRTSLAINRAALGERHADTATSYANLAAAIGAQGRYAEAEPLLRRGLEIYRASVGEQHDKTGSAYGSLAGNLATQGRHAEAEPLLRKTIEIRQAALGQQHPALLTTYNNLAHTLNQQRRFAEAEVQAATAISIARALRLRDRALASAETGARPLTERDTYGFHNYLLAAWGMSIQQPAEGPRLRLAAFTAAQDADRGSVGEALAQSAARAAAGGVGLAEAIRRRQELALLIRAQDARLLRTLAARDQTGAAALRAEALRSTQELRGLDEQIRSRFPRYAELTSPQALEVADLQARLAVNEGVLLMIPSGDNIHVFAVSKSQVEWRLLGGGSKRVAQVASALRCQVDPATCAQVGSTDARGAGGAYGAAPVASPRDFDRAAAYGLYRDLIQPVEGALTGVETLYVTASGPLSGLPLGLLLTQEPPHGALGDVDSQALAELRWLADKYALVTLPSVSSLRALGALKIQPGRLALAGFGDPVLAGSGASARGVFRSAAANGQGLADGGTLAGLAALPGTRTELQAMASALGAPASAVRLGPAATETAVKTSADLSQARVVIFATHGLLPRELKGLEEPGLVFTPPAAATAEDDGVLTASEAARLNLSADWVILSACNTAAADGTPGAESLSGLAKAFLYAGAQALLASHWRVADDSTSVLTVQTLAIQKANPSLSKAQALQAAMKAVRTGKLPDGSPLPGWKPQWAHPAAWAPFTLVSAGT